MGLVGVLASVRHLRLAFTMVASVAHVLRVVLLVEVRAQEHVLLVADLTVPVLVQHRLLLEVADGVLGELLSLVALCDLSTGNVGAALETYKGFPGEHYLVGQLLFQLE